MFQAFLNVFRIAELRNKLLFTIAMLAIYRIGFWIPLAGVDQVRLAAMVSQQQQEGSAATKLFNYMSTFTGGDLSRSTVFGLGVMPYISAAIIFQLLATALPSLQKLQKEGPTGQQKIQEWTRYSTVGLCILQGFGWMFYMQSQGEIYPQIVNSTGALWAFRFSSVLALVAGTTFLMWLGEQIDRFGLGNGVSLIITAGILSRIPNAIGYVVSNFSFNTKAESNLGPVEVGFLVISFFLVTAGAIVITVAQRRIPIQQAKHTRGRRVYGGQKAFLPLRVNHGGVMPIIFAQSLMIFPSVGVSSLQSMTGNSSHIWWNDFTAFLARNLTMGRYPYIVLEIALIYFFSYFWTTVQFNPKEMSDQLREHGSFIKGLRPGPRTTEYLETVLERVTYAGGGFLALIAVIPELVASNLQIPYNVSSFLGGTGLLIIVAVGLDFVQRIEANLLMRNYAGFLGGGGSGDRIRGGRSGG